MVRTHSKKQSQSGAKAAARQPRGVADLVAKVGRAKVLSDKSRMSPGARKCLATEVARAFYDALHQIPEVLITGTCMDAVNGKTPSADKPTGANKLREASAMVMARVAPRHMSVRGTHFEDRSCVRKIELCAIEREAQRRAISELTAENRARREMKKAKRSKKEKKEKAKKVKARHAGHD